MNLKVFIEKITRLENSIDMSKLKSYDFNPWPYIRLKILNRCSTENITQNKSILTTDNKNKVRKVNDFIKSFFMYVKNPIKKTRVDIIYFTRLSESQDVVENKLFNRYADSLNYFFSKDYKIKTLEISDQEWMDDKQYFNKNITYITFIIKLTRVKYKLISKFRPAKTYLFNDLNQEIQKSFGFQVDLGSELAYINYLSLQFMKILKYYSPKLVFLTVFYRPEAMAMSLACNRLGIKTVEYQHGAQNDYHAMYTHWENIPKEGYELIPDIFWMWGNVPKARIDKWAINTTKHRAVLGGNLWMTYFKERKNENKSLEECYKKSKKNILVSLQGDQFFPDFLLEGIKENSDDIIWHFRDHPRLPISNNLKKKITDLRNTEIDFSTKSPLYELLKVSDIHITAYSTVAFEAQSFNISTIFIHPNALNGYNKLINNNGLFYAKSLEDLNILIKKLLSQEVAVESQYIVSDVITHEKVLHMLMDKKCN